MGQEKGSQVRTTDSPVMLSQSTYAMVTEERILGLLGIYFNAHDLSKAASFKQGLYYLISKVPVAHVLNGIILQQVIDYQVYLQKLYVDYLMSGNGNETADASGQDVRMALDSNRDLVNQLNETIQQVELQHYQLISGTQKELIQATTRLHPDLLAIADDIAARGIEGQREANAIKKRLLRIIIEINIEEEGVDDRFYQRVTETLNMSPNTRHFSLAMLSSHLQSRLAPWQDKAQEMKVTLCQLRQDLMNMIVKTRDLLILVPNYSLDETSRPENLDQINFDRHIGE